MEPSSIWLRKGTAKQVAIKIVINLLINSNLYHDRKILSVSENKTEKIWNIYQYSKTENG